MGGIVCKLIVIGRNIHNMVYMCIQNKRETDYMILWFLA